MNRIALLFEVLLLTVAIAFNGHAQTDAAIPEAPHWQVLLQQATDLFGQWKEQEAIELCRQVLQSDAPLATKAEAHGVLAEIYLSLGQFDAAIAQAQAALGMEGLEEEDRAELEAKIEEIGQTRAEFGRRISSYRAILGSGPAPEEAARVRYELAFTYLVYGWREEAKREAEGLIGAYPASEWASKAAGRIASFCAMVGDAEQAEQYYDQVVRSYIAQGNPMKAVRLIQRRHLRKKDPEGAIAALKALISTHPGTETAAAALLGVGEVHKRYRRLNLARRAYERLVAEYPGTPAAVEAEYALGDYYASRGMPEMAEAQWLSLLDKRPNVPEDLAKRAHIRLAHIWWDRALAANSAADLEGAIQNMEMVVNEPAWDWSRQGPLSLLGDWYKVADRYDDAIRTYRALVDEFSDVAQVDAKLLTHYRIAECYRLDRRYEEAINELEAILAQEPREELLVFAGTVGYVPLKVKCQEEIERLQVLIQTSNTTGEQR